MIEIKTNIHAPPIAFRLEEDLHKIENLDECALTVQLTYRDHHTSFYLNNVTYINFDNEFVEIRQKNNSISYLAYQEILEYNLIHINDLLDWEGY